MIKDHNIDIKHINEIINKTIDDIVASRKQIMDIVENAHSEYEYLKLELEDVKTELAKVIAEVDTLEIKDKIMRKKLADVSKNFGSHSEEEIKRTYEMASEIRIQFITKQNDEKSLQIKRTQLELLFKKNMNTIRNAENVVNQISIAISFLKGELISAIEGMDNNSQMNVGIKILEAQENERKRIARDIHDGPAQFIANVIMKADICERIIKQDLAKGLIELKNLKNSMRTALREVRQIIVDLRPMSIDALGIEHAIGEFIQHFTQDYPIEVHTKIKPLKTDMDSVIQTALYRIIQEIFNNIKKHADAKRIELKLDYGSKYLQLILADDGVGFDVDKTLDNVRSNGESFGLLGILERVTQLQGSIHINSTPGAGTVFNIKLPISCEVIHEKSSN